MWYTSCILLQTHGTLLNWKYQYPTHFQHILEQLLIFHWTCRPTVHPVVQYATIGAEEETVANSEDRFTEFHWIVPTRGEGGRREGGKGGRGEGGRREGGERDGVRRRREIHNTGALDYCIVCCHYLFIHHGDSSLNLFSFSYANSTLSWYNSIPWFIPIEVIIIITIILTIMY